MSNQNNSGKPRLADVAKKNTTDRASKLASAFLPRAITPTEEPPAPIASVAEEQAVTENLVASISPVVDDIPATTTDEQPERTPEPSVAKPKERARKSGSSINIADAVNQPTPDGLRCAKPIMLSDAHHEMIRSLAFKYKKPLSSILYNLLEVIDQTYQRELKGDQSNA